MTRQYLDLLRHIVGKGITRHNRTGVDTIAVFGYQMRFDLSQGFPLLTTKKMFTRGVFEELAWFLRGETNIKPLVDKNVHIWDGDAYRHNKDKPGFPYASKEEYIAAIKTDNDAATRWGDLGPVYGKQWRNFNGVDQIVELEEGLRKNPDSRRHILNAWDPRAVKEVALPPCHVLSQFNVADGKLSCQLYQRSADTFLGVPFNIASYAALTHLLAHTAGLEPGEFIHTFGDVHIYMNHFDAVKEQLAREPRPLPRLTIQRPLANILEYRPGDLKIDGYDPYPGIDAPLNVG